MKAFLNREGFYFLYAFLAAVAVRTNSANIT